MFNPEQIIKTKSFKLSPFNVIGSAEWTNKKGEDKKGIIIKVGELEDGTMITLTYSPKLITAFKILEDKSIVSTDSNDFQFIKVKFFVGSEKRYILSTLQNGEFEQEEVDEKVLFDLLEKQQEVADEFINSKIAVDSGKI